MEVKAGYKQTEVGIIPEDWDVVNLSSLSKGLQNGVFFKPSRKGRGVKLINVGDLYVHIPIDLENLELFDATNDEVARFMVKSGDLFFTRSSVVPSGIAHCNIYLSPKFETIVFDSHVIRCRPDAKNVNSSYLFRYCVASTARNYLVSHAKTGTMTTIDQGVLARCPVVIPPTLAEQEAIAEALSDADTLIEALEQLIAKKRQVKQGAMSELLTGKRRVVESGEWEVKTIGEIGYKFLNGGTPSTKKEEYWEGNIPWITGADFIDQKVADIRRYITTEAVNNSATNVIEKGNLLVVTRTGVGKIAIAPFDLAISQDITGVYLKKEYMLPEFLYWYFTYNTGSLRNLNQGTSIAGITRDTLISLSVPVPPLLEQTAIAEILSDMDAEIAALEEKLSKAREVKAGMMSVLLTGRVRLV